MAKVCAFCDKKVSGKGKDISFEHNGFSFTIWNSSTLCPECEQEGFLETFKEVEGRLVARKDGKIAVNWPLLVEREISRSRLADLHRILYALGVFSHSPEGNWEIIGPVCLNPRTAPGSHAFFVREEDAIGYARAKLANTSYSWQIHHVDKVISKNQALDL